MLLDLTLAIVHHIFVFTLFGIIASELVLVQDGMTGAGIKRVVFIDRWYGIVAGLVLVAGFSRAIFAAKGWAYYAANSFFWAKIGIFALIGILSVWPTVQFIRWRRTYEAAGETPKASIVSTVRGLLWAEVALFALLPAFAAAMARGYGE